ncbi:UNVERIFIED_CONTAM: hypothetical protein FKN15_068207 [Acipenser sinensis]
MESKENGTGFPSFTQLEHFLVEHNSNFVWLLVATILSCGWIIYLTYYNSRNVGLILTVILNRLYKNGHIHIGSFSFSVLSGKVMFRDIYFINEDMSIRIQDGFLIFRWWKMYNPKQKQHDPKAETRLYITVNGFEFHVYNQTELYAHLQEMFGLEPTIIPPKKDDDKAKDEREKTLESVQIKTETQDPSSSWRALIPVIKVNISTETNAVHVNVGAGSYLEVNIPMTVGETGYSPTIKGQLLHVDTTSSMQYRTLLEAEMLAFHVNASYPRIWNMPQAWQCEIEVYKATYHFIYAQKNFFTDLIQDWASDSAPDIYSFVPYSWKFQVMFHQFEMIWAANQHNWIDCSTKQQENVSEMEETMLSVLRPSQKPEDRTASSPNQFNRFPLDPSELPPDRLHVELELSPDSQMTLYGPMLKALFSIKENYFGEDDMYTDFEEAVSSPVLSLSTSSSSGWTAVGVEDCEKKENENGTKQIHPLTLRPWEITVLINLYKVHGRLPVHCSSDGPECPAAYLERLCFEMKKGYKETMLQLVLSPVHIFMSDSYQRPATDGVLREGHISLSGLQLRAHAMFSAEGLPLGSDSLEYAWLIDVQAGALTAKVTVPQLASLLEWGETFVFHVVSREFELERPKSMVICQHGVDRRFCKAKLTCVPGPCRTSEDVKYTMTRLAVDCADLFVVEQGCAANIKTSAIRLANCNLHNQAVGEGISAVVQDVQIRQFIELQDSCRLGVQTSVLRRSYWLEAGSVNFGLITADVALAADHPSKHEVQRQFLEMHDNRTKRLWFLWPEDVARNKRSRNRCGCLGGCRFFGGTAAGLDFFKLDEVTPSSSSAFSSCSADSDMCYGQSLLQPAEWIIIKEAPKLPEGKTNGTKKKEWDTRSLGADLEKKGQLLSLQVPLRSHSSTSSSDENSSSSAALPLLASEKDSPSPSTDEHIVHVEFTPGSKPQGVSGDSTSSSDENSSSSAALPLLASEKDSPSPSTDEHIVHVEFTPGSKPQGVSGEVLAEAPESTPVSPSSTQDRSSLRSPLRSPLTRQASVCSTRLGSTKSLSAAVFERQPPPAGVQFSSEVSRSDENVLDSPRQRRSFGSFPFTPSADSNSFHQYRSMDSSMSMADSEAYFSAAEEFDPISSDECPGTYPGRKKKKKHAQQINCSRNSIYHSIEGPLTYVLNGETIHEPRPLPIPTHPSQASFVSALGVEEESAEHVYSAEMENVPEVGQMTSQPHVMNCYQNYLSHYQVFNWLVKQPTNKRTSKSSLHRPLDLDTPTSEESSSSYDQLSIPAFKIVKHGLSANSLLDRGVQLMGSSSSTPYTPLDKKAMENTDDETITEDWTLDQPLSQTRTTAIVEVKGAVDVVLTPLMAEALDRYIEAMVHFASNRHPASIVDDLHGKVLSEAYQISKSTVSDSASTKHESRGSKIENAAPGSTNSGNKQTDLSAKQDNVKIKGLQANVSIPKVNLCLLQVSVEEGSPSSSSKNVTHVSLVALCFDRIATQVRMNRGVVEEGPNNTEHGRPSVSFEKYASATKMQPQSSGSLRSNAGIEKGKEIAAKLNIHRIHGQLRGLDTSDIGTCAITAIPFEKSKVLFSLEELDELTFVDETDPQGGPDLTRTAASLEKWGWIMFECGIENLTVKGGRQSGAVLYSAFGVMGKADATERNGLLKSNGSSGSQTGSGYSTDVSEDNLPQDGANPFSDVNGNSDSDEQDEGVESDDLKKDLPLMPPPPDSSSMKLTITEIWFSFAAPTNVRSPAQTFSRQLNLLSTATPAIGAWLIPIDQLKSSLNKLETEGTLRVCAVMGCIMTEALEKKGIHIPLRSKYNRVTKRARCLQENPSCLLCNILHHYLQLADYSIIEEATMNDGLPALVTLKKGLVALARQWMKFIVVTQGFKAIGLLRPAQLPKPQEGSQHAYEAGQGLDNGGGLQSDTSADGAEFEFDAAPVSEHTMLLEGTSARPPPAGVTPGPGVHPYQSLSYTSGDTAADSPAHVSRAGVPVKESPRKESLLSYLTGSFPSLHNLLEGTPQRNAGGGKNSSLTRTANNVAPDMLTEHPLLSEPSSVSFYNWMSNAVGNRGSVVPESPVTRSGHNSLQTGITYNLPTIPSASDFNTVLSSDQNTLDGSHSQHSTSQHDIADIEEMNQGPLAVQLADAQVVFKPLLSHTGIQSQDTAPLRYRMYFGEHLSFSGTLECLRADIVDSDTSKERKNKRSRRQGAVNLPPLDFKPALMFETFSINAVVMEKSMSTPQNSTSALSFHDLNRRHYNTFHCNFTISCQSISQHVDMALVRLIHQFSTMIDDIKATQTDIKLSRYTAGSASPTPTFKTRKHGVFRSSDFSRSSRGSLNGGNRGNNKKSNRAANENNKKEPRNKNSLGRSERRTSKVSRKGSREVADHMTIHMDDSDSITVSEQSEPSAECWQNMYKLLNFYSLISDPTGILEKASPETGFPTDGGRSPSEPSCRVIFENEQDSSSPHKLQRKRSLVSNEPHHVTLIVFGIGMVNRTHLEADIGGLTMEAELKKIHGSFTLKEKMKDILHQKMTETCASAHVGGVNIVLLEGITPNIQTVVKCNIVKSQALYSAQRGLKTNNAAVFKVGTILINIPQHPATLHSMMVRSSHQLSKQISDLIRQPSTAPQPPREDVSTPHSSEKTTSSVNQTPVEATEFPQLPEGLEKKPIVLKFSVMLDGITIGAALLPSLKAEYKMGRMKSHGMTGAQTSFTFELPNHKLRFQSKISPVDMSTMPPSASLNLPPVTMSGEYIMEEHDSHSDQPWTGDDFPSKQGNYLQGNYLRCVAEIGSFEHNLTTDLLNHLVFLQKVFMKEVNEVIQKTTSSVNQTPVEATEFPQLPEGLEKKPIVLKFSVMLDGITIGAALLPSLKAEYKMGRMKSHGMTGAQTSFTFELPNHKLRFQSKISPVDMSTMPPSASLNLPPVTMSGEYIMEEHDSHSDQPWTGDDFPSKQGNYLQGNYLRCVAEIGSFEHNLTTDLLNHLVFLQKVFMKEVNEVIQKVSGGEQPIPLWNEHDLSTDGDKPKILLYSLNLMFKGIQVTATTPSMRAVRFETGLIEVELSNRIQSKAQPGSRSYLKLFGKCQVDLNLALGQIVKHQVYEEAGSDFHQVAYFKTRIGLRNALQEEISCSSDKEAVLITLNRPIVYAQPVAFDRAVLFWLNYKAAYDNWNEQRLALNKDIHVATKEVVDKLPGIQQTSAQAFSTLFLQLTVNDLGICLPITNPSQANHSIDFDTGSALVLTIESTMITACSSESLVSKGHFKNFCIRFAEGFETTWDDWKPEARGDMVMNACVVPDGTYEVCSRTTGQQSAESSSAGTWTLNVLWKMCGIDVHMDPNIGKRLNALGNTFTSLTGEEDVDDIADLNSINMADISDEDEPDTMSPIIHANTEGPAVTGLDCTRLTLRKRLVNHLLESSSAGTWTLNVLWKMCGIDVHMDPNIGKRLNALGNTFTSLTGEEDVDDIADLNSINMADISDEDEPDTMSPIIHAEPIEHRRQGLTGGPTAEGRGRKFTKRLVDTRELNEQAKVIDDLKKLGASEGTINQEIQRYQQLESVAVNDIRRDVRKKLRRSSMRAASLKDKWGLGYKPSNSRSKSIATTGRPPLKRLERASSRIGDGEDQPDIRVDASSPGPRVTFNIQDTFPEETELDLLSVTIEGPPHFPSVSEGVCSVFSTPNTPVVFSPTIPFQHEDSRRDDSLSSSSEDSDKEEDYDRERPCYYRRTPQTSRKKSSGFAAVSQLFSERWPGTPANKSILSATTERNIDFELDIRVEIDSGKCVLHPTTQPPEHDDISLQRSYDRSSRSLDQESPPKKKKLQPTYTSATHLLSGKKVPSSLQTKSSDFETTVFYIPGVDVKLHYNSKTMKTESPNASRGSSLPRTFSKESKLYGMKDSGTAPPPTTTQSKTNMLLPPPPPPLPSAKGKGSGSVKAAKLYAWVALQTLPEEMVISPCLLDFLEKALETIPITPIERNYTAISSQDEDMGQFDSVDQLEVSTTSLVSSSTFAYSSFPVDVVVYVRVQPSQIKFSCLPMSRVECMLKLPSLDLVFSSNRGELETPATTHTADGGPPAGPTTPLVQNELKTAGNKGPSPGLGSPLGRTRHSSSQSDLASSNASSSGLSFTACMSDFSLYVFHPYGAGKQTSAVAGHPGSGPLGPSPGLGSPLGRTRHSSSQSDLTSANASSSGLSFTACMSDFSLYVFHPYGAGKQTSAATGLTPGSGPLGTVDEEPSSVTGRKDSLSINLEFVKVSLSRMRRSGGALFIESMVPGKGGKIETTLINISAVCDIGSASFKYDMRRLSEILAFPRAWYRRSIARRLFLGDQTINLPDSITKTSMPSFNKASKIASQQGSPWETLVVFAINLKQLNVQMNMSNVMGNNTWTTSGLKSQGRLSVGSNRDREISMSVGLGRSKLDSKGGVVGGNIDVNTLEMVAHISEHPNQQPSHKIQITLGSTEARVDYMGSSILMGIFSNADLQLQDEWKVNLCNTQETSLSEKSEVFVHGDLQWDIFQVIISRSTTPDLIKIGMKLQEFFTQQFDTSKRALSTWGPVPYMPPKAPVINVGKGSDEQCSSDDSTYIVQTLDFHLGHNTMVTKPCGALESPMATITKITRRRHENPPHGVASVKEWFNYVTAMRNEELNLLRNVDANNTESGVAAKSSSLLSGFRGGLSYNHETETIFALPRMQLDFKSIHVQEPEEPALQETNSKPNVECSVVTEFTDHICVTMDAELIMFLHDLVSAYLKEKEKALFPPRLFATRPGQKSPTTIHDENSGEKDKEETINYTTVDWREFICNTWHLEPTLRLISWTGRKIDPVGVDYILQKLGFHHARTTIPKWLQRGVMDPLDKVLSVLIKKLGTALQDEKEKKGRDKEEH